MSKDIEDKIVDLIYTYLVNYISNNKLKELTNDLRYYIDGSWKDTEMDTYLEDFDEFLHKELEVI